MIPSLKILATPLTVHANYTEIYLLLKKRLAKKSKNNRNVTSRRYTKIATLINLYYKSRTLIIICFQIRTFKEKHASNLTEDLKKLNAFFPNGAERSNGMSTDTGNAFTGDSFGQCLQTR